MLVVLAVEVDPLPAVRALRATADVIDVDGCDNFCASVLVVPGQPAVARLARSLRGSPSEGEVLYQVMLHTTGLYGTGYFVWRLAEALC